MKFKQDGGYGDRGNMTKYYFLYHILNEKQRIKYEKELEKKDPKKYHEFKDSIDRYHKALEYQKNKNKKEE